MNENLIVALIGAFAALTGGVLTGMIGVWYGRRARAEDQAERSGELRGRIETMHAPGLGSGSVMMLLGRLQADVSNLIADVAEVRKSQEGSRDLFTIFKQDVTELKGKFEDLRRQVANLSRRTK